VEHQDAEQEEYSTGGGSPSQHTGTLYKLDPEQARRDGAANHQLEEEEEATTRLRPCLLVRPEVWRFLFSVLLGGLPHIERVAGLTPCPTTPCRQSHRRWPQLQQTWPKRVKAAKPTRTTTPGWTLSFIKLTNDRCTIRKALWV
jgi:hypothetical protein